MSYQLFDQNNQEVSNSDLQNRSIWYQLGVRKEDVFVHRYGERLNISINPEKRIDPTVPDLVHNGNLADLKCQNTPFFQAFKYKVEPTYAVTFNLKDAYNYGVWGKNHKDLVIFYWVNWVAVKMVSSGKSFTVKPLTGLWKVPFTTLDKLRKTRPIHWYNQRDRRLEKNPELKKALADFEPRLVDGTNVWSIRETHVNAACSYIFDLRSFERVE